MSLITLLWMTSLSYSFDAKRLSSQPLEFHFIDVGYGDALIMTLPEGGRGLIDAGPPDRGLQLVEILQEMGISHLDFIFLTHFHKDHVGGLTTIIKEIPLRNSLSGNRSAEIFMPFIPTTIDPMIEPIISSIQQHPYRIIDRGETIILSPTVRMEVLHPERISGDQNEDSLVVKVLHGNISVLLAADIGITAQRELVSEYGSGLKCNVIKIPHHAGEMDAEFVQAVNAEIAILTIGPNPYGSPNQEVLNKYRESGARIFRTDQNGNITATSNGKTIQIKTDRSQ